MYVFNKADMLYSDYEWTIYVRDHPKVSGMPDNTIFNRQEGYEMLYMVNKFVINLGWKEVSDCRKVERMLHDHLPENIKLQLQVWHWVYDAWAFY